MDNSKNSSMMFEHLEGYVNECVKHLAIGSIAPQDNTDAEFFDEHDRIRNEDNTLTPAIDYYTLAGVEGGGMNHDRVYVCVGRMFLFFIVQKSLKLFIGNGRLDTEDGKLTPQYIAYRDIKKIQYHPTDLILCKIEVSGMFPFTIKTDEREKLLQEVVVHVRTDHVFRTWTPATQAKEKITKGISKNAEAIDLAAPAKGYAKHLYNGYFFFLPETFEQGGVNVYQDTAEGQCELTVDIPDSQEVSQLNSQEARLLRQETEEKAREDLPHGHSMNYLTVTASQYTKRMNLRGDMSSWGCYLVWHKIGKAGLNLAVIGLRRKFIPSNGNTYQNIFIRVKARQEGGGGDEAAQAEADEKFINTVRSIADSISPEAVPGMYDDIVVAQTAKALALDNGSLDWFLQRLAFLPLLGWGWEGAQLQFTFYIISMLERIQFPEVALDEFIELCRDEYGEDLPGLNQDAFENPFKDFIHVLPPLNGLSVKEWESRVAGYLGYCVDGGIMPDYVNIDSLLMVANYKNYPDFWKHVTEDPQAYEELQIAAQEVQALIRYFLHCRLLEDPNEEMKVDWSIPIKKPVDPKAKQKPGEIEELPPQLRPMLYDVEPQTGEMKDIVYNERIMTRLVQSGYLRWDFLPKMEPEKQIKIEGANKKLKKFIKQLVKAKAKEADRAAQKAEEAPEAAAPEADGAAPAEADEPKQPRGIKKKAQPLDSWLENKEKAMRALFEDKKKAKNKKGTSNKNWAEQHDNLVLVPALLKLLDEHEQYEAKDKLPEKEKAKFNAFTTGVQECVRHICLTHEKCKAMSEYFQVLVYLMEDSQDSDLLCTISQEIAFLAEQVYDQRRADRGNTRSYTPFNDCLLLPFSDEIGGLQGRAKTLVSMLITEFVMKQYDEYLTLCGLRCLINLAGLSDECKLQLLSADGHQLLNFLSHRVRDFYNNESICAAWCILIRNLASSEYCRQIISENSELRKHLLTYSSMLLQQDAIVLGTFSDSRNMMTAEACACLWKLAQPYEQQMFQTERLQKWEMQKLKHKQAKEPTPNLESPLLEEIVIGKRGFLEPLFTLIQTHVAAEMSESSNLVLEKACGLAMAIAAADSTIKEMDKHIKELEKKGESKLVERQRRIRPKGNMSKKESGTIPISAQMGPRFVKEFCTALMMKQKSRPVVEKAAGALCVLLYDQTNKNEFMNHLPNLSGFLSMQPAKAEVQLTNLLMQLAIFASG